MTSPVSPFGGANQATLGSRLPVLALVAWWGGFVAGPVPGLVAYLTGADDALTRLHGRAATAVWAAILGWWAPFVVWAVVLGDAPPDALPMGAAAAALVAACFCGAGTIQALRGRSLTGREVRPVA